MSYNYIDSKASQNELKIAELLTFLPKFCHDYIISISSDSIGISAAHTIFSLLAVG